MDTITAKNIFTNSFLAMQGQTSASSVIEILVSIVASFLMGFFIFFVYKKTFQGVLYQRSFAVSLMVTTMILTLIIMVIKGNLILSLGMVGALSIVRFRTPIKDPMDLVFIFWSIAVGIANGVGFFHISLIGSLAITAVLILMSKKFITEDGPYLLVLKLAENADSSKIAGMIRKSVKKIYLKSKTITADYCEIIFEVRIANGNFSFMNELKKDSAIQQSSLISYSGDIAATTS